MALRFTQIADVEIKGVQDQFQRRLGEGTAGAGELDQGSTTVVGIVNPHDEAPLLQSPDRLGRPAGGLHQRRRQFTGRSPVWLAGDQQGDEGGELRRVERVGGEGDAQPRLELTARSHHRNEHPDGRAVLVTDERGESTQQILVSFGHGRIVPVAVAGLLADSH